jgi:hypothetical protein
MAWAAVTCSLSHSQLTLFETFRSDERSSLVYLNISPVCSRFPCYTGYVIIENFIYYQLAETFLFSVFKIHLIFNNLKFKIKKIKI